MCHYRQLTASLQSACKGSVFTLSSQRAATLLAIQARHGHPDPDCLCADSITSNTACPQQPFGFATAPAYLVELQSDQRQAPAAGEKLAQLYSLQQHWQQQAAVAKVSLQPQLRHYIALVMINGKRGVASDSAFSAPQRTAGALIDEHFIPLLQIPLLSGRQFSAADIRFSRPTGAAQSNSGATSYPPTVTADCDPGAAFIPGLIASNPNNPIR